MLTVILTGGASRRMGHDKAMLPVDGKAMALMLAEKYSELGPVAFSVDRKGRFPAGEYRELEDSFPGCGPLNGLVSAFEQTEEDVIFLTATDMPGGDLAAVRRLLAHLGEYDACLYENEPLFGIYRRSCYEPALKCLEEGEYALRRFLCRINGLQLPAEHRDVLLNLNTPEDYRAFLNKNRQQ